MIIAIDTGGTKTLLARFDDGQMTSRVKIATPRDQSTYLETIVHETSNLLQGETPSAISIALPGVIRNQIAVICKNLDWYDFDIITKLQPHWPGVHIYLENDANLGAVGAANRLDAKHQKLLYITLSTGVGGGVAVDGKIEPALSEAEFGDIYLEYQSHITTWEDIASGRAVSKIYPEPLAVGTDEEVKSEIARRVSRGLLAILPVIRPDIVAIGGGFGAKYEHIRPLVERELSILPDQYLTEVKTAPDPEEIVAYGCYYYAKDQLDAREDI